MLVVITIDEAVDGYRLDIADYRKESYGTIKENPERYAEALMRVTRWLREEAEKEQARLLEGVSMGVIE